MSWHKIANHINELSFSAANLAAINIAGKKICVAKTSSGLRACADTCPHAGAKLSEGTVDSRGNILCHLHHYQFSLTTGRDIGNEGYFLKVYKVMENEEGIFIFIE